MALHRRVARCLAALTALLVGYAIWHGVHGPGPVSDALYTAIEVGAAALCGARAVLRRGERLAWGLLAGYATLWAVGDGIWTFWLTDLDDAPEVSWADPAYVASYLLACGGMLALLRQRLWPPRASLSLDGLLVGLTCASVLVAVLFAPALQDAGGSALEVATTVGYVAFDLLLLCLAGVAFGLTGWRPGRTWSLIGLSLLLLTLADAVFGYLETTGSYGSAWADPLWPAALVALAGAAWQPAGQRRAVRETMPVVTLPACLAVVDLGVLVAAQLTPVDLVATLLAAAALLVGGVRALLTLTENVALLRASRDEALTDGLTGLGNRRCLMADLDQAVAACADGTARTLLFFDLDGFKSYNDTFGHAAGDVLLARLGRDLATAVAGAGRAYRLGGDEFCVLLDGRQGTAAPVVLRARAALQTRGEGFAVGASCGSVVLPDEAPDATLALQLADERMYAAKHSGRRSPRHQVRDLLLQVLRERDADLEEHVDDVGSLALAVGRRLGLDDAELDVLARGAELHDIGKVAIPDSILRAPRPLDELEWRIMRQHTIIGERILAAAPAMRPVAALVRSSHEHFDGSGYPDGLAGDAIPLGARIIAICDAYDAMRQDRPYAPPMDQAEAVAELRRCAGTQFDPHVVEAFAQLLAEGHQPQLRVA